MIRLELLVDPQHCNVAADKLRPALPDGDQHLLGPVRVAVVAHRPVKRRNVARQLLDVGLHDVQVYLGRGLLYGGRDLDLGPPGFDEIPV